MTHTLAEHESKRLLRDYGVPVALERVVETEADAVTAAEEIGYPVVVKLTAKAITHKTERGLVRLGLQSASDVSRAARDLLGAARPEDGSVALLVAPMLRGTRELIAGLHVDAQFGCCVMVGLGGVLAEALHDVAFRLVPIDDADAYDMLDDLRTQAMLREFRGEPPVDRDAVVSVLMGLSRLAQERPDVAAVDVNPMIVVEGIPVAVDAMVELRRATPGVGA